MSAEAVRLERVRAAMAGRSVSLALDLRVATGEWVVLIGPSGSGKSLILELAAGLVLPDEGRVSVLGREWSAPTDDHQTSLRLRIGAVLQPPGLLSNMTVFNNVALPLRYHRFALSDREREQIVATHLDHMALLPLRDRFPAELNPGEIRRAAIARAMVLDPDVLLLDDPVDGLDIDMVLRLRRYLEESRAVRPMAVLMALRAWSPLAESADRVALLRDGRIEQVGPRDQVRAAAAAELKSFLG